MALITPLCIKYNTVKYNLEYLTIIGKESYIRPLAKQLKINLPLGNNYLTKSSSNVKLGIPSNKLLNA